MGHGASRRAARRPVPGTCCGAWGSGLGNCPEEGLVGMPGAPTSQQGHPGAWPAVQSSPFPPAAAGQGLTTASPLGPSRQVSSPGSPAAPASPEQAALAAGQPSLRAAQEDKVRQGPGQGSGSSLGRVTS